MTVTFDDNIDKIQAIINGDIMPHTSSLKREIANYIFTHDLFHELSESSKSSLTHKILHQLSGECENLTSIEFPVKNISFDASKELEHHKIWTNISLYINDYTFSCEKIIDDVGNQFIVSEIKFSVNWPSAGSTGPAQTKEFVSALMKASELCSELTKLFSKEFYRCISTPERMAHQNKLNKRFAKQKKAELLAITHSKFMRVGSRKDKIHIEKIDSENFNDFDKGEVIEVWNPRGGKRFKVQFLTFIDFKNDRHWTVEIKRVS